MGCVARVGGARIFKKTRGPQSSELRKFRLTTYKRTRQLAKR